MGAIEFVLCLIFCVVWCNITHFLTKAYYLKKLENVKPTFNLDSSIAQFWELRKLENPTTGALVLVIDDENQYYACMGVVEGKKATAYSVSKILFARDQKWTSSEMYDLQIALKNNKNRLKQLQEKFAKEEKQLEERKDRLLQIEANEEIKLLTD